MAAEREERHCGMHAGVLSLRQVPLLPTTTIRPPPPLPHYRRFLNQH